MSTYSRISRWSVSVGMLCVLVVAIAATRATQAQDANRPGGSLAFGLARALAVDVHDPQAAGRIRIKVKFPWLPREVETWARVSLPLGGNRTGLWALPEVGDEVLVGFENGDARTPIVLGSLWDGKPPPTSGR